ncbi:MAG: DUF4440 domain-containing protein [Bacteroidia bacterium]
MRFIILSLLTALCLQTQAQQLPDTTFIPDIDQAAYMRGEGPMIFIDEGHNNLHAASQGFGGFIKMMKMDGFRVERVKTLFEDAESLKNCDILIIANAIHERNTNGNWVVPNPSAFSKKEIKTIKQWVDNGGKLLLIADHMPFSGAAYDLGKAFGFKWLNGFAKIKPYFWPPSHFEGDMIPKSPVSEGLKSMEGINRIASFSGSAFLPPKNAIPVLNFLPENQSLQPDTAWRFKDDTPTKSLEGYCQGALLEYGSGKMAAWGEAGMFSAQIIMGDVKAGFNSPYAPQNAQMVLNLMHWLADTKKYTGPESVDMPYPPSKIEEEILAVNKKMEEAVAQNDMLTISYFYDDHAVVTGHKHEEKGREAIDAYWEELRGRCIKWKLENIHIEGQGTLAYQRGISHLTYYDQSGKEITTVVRFTLVWKKNTAGNWKIMVDHYTWK